MVHQTVLAFKNNFFLIFFNNFSKLIFKFDLKGLNVHSIF